MSDLQRTWKYSNGDWILCGDSAVTQRTWKYSNNSWELCNEIGTSGQGPGFQRTWKYENGQWVLCGEVCPTAAPIANPISISINKGASEEIILDATDSDGDSLTYYVTTLPQYGTLYADQSETTPVTILTPLASNVVYYAHDDSYNINDSFTYKANDGIGDSNIAPVTITVGIAPGDNLSFSGKDGVYRTAVVVGTGAGTFKGHFNSISVPDRFQIFFDSAGISNDLADMEIVADSLWVGDDTSNASYGLNNLGGTFTKNLYTYNGNSFDLTSSNSETVVINNSNVTNTGAGNRTDLVPNGPSKDGLGIQLGVQNLVYDSTNGPAGSSLVDLPYYDGNICLTFEKPETTSNVAYILVSGSHSSTAWNMWYSEFDPA